MAVVVLSLGFVAPARSLGALADADAQKAALKCQTLIAKTTTKALATKLKAFDACATTALSCVETKADKADCAAKAAATCSKKLTGATTAAVKAQTKIVTNKSCLALTPTELLETDGLGFGAVAGTCATDFGIDVCGGLEPIAACMLTSHDAGAGALLGRAAPRTAELLALLPGAPIANTTGLPTTTGGCGDCSAPVDKRKGVEKCGKALTAGTRAVAAALENAFGKCTLERYECAQTKGDAPACITAATAACTKAAATVTKATAKLATVAGKGCSVDFTAASAANGLNLTALATRCAGLGVTPLDGPSALAACLAAESRCTVATLARSAVPLTAAFAPAELGTLAADLAATCPSASSLQKARAVVPRSIFGSMLKVVKSVTRALPSAVGVRASGGKPSSSGGTTSGVSKVNGPSRVKFGGFGKYRVSYHGSRSRIGGGNQDAPPPVMIVAISRPDIVLDDHFEIPLLDLPGDGTDIEDEIEVEFSDTIPACAFELSFSTKSGDEVGTYASILQVLEDDKPVLPTVELVSRGPGGVQQDGAASATGVAISAGGRYVVFTSAAANLVTPIDGNGVTDVFLRDRCVADGVAIKGCTPSTTLESNGPGGSGVAGHVGVSEDGRWIAFDVLRPNDPNPPFVQAYVRDRCLANGAPVDSCTEITENVSFDSETFSTEGVLSGITATGRFVTFSAPVSGPPLAVSVLDRCVTTNDTTDPVFPGCEAFPDRVSDLLTGGPSNGDSTFGVVSRNGRFVVYRSDSTDLVPSGGDTNLANDVFLFDRCLDFATGLNLPECARTTTRVNVTPTGFQSVGDPSGSTLTNVALSDDGRYIVFASFAPDLLGSNNDTNGKRDVFVHDRCLYGLEPVPGCTPTTERVNVGPGGTESNGTLPDGQALGMSADGRLIVFASDATNLLGPAVGTPNGTFQIFLRDRCLTNGVAIAGCTPSTTLVSAAPDKGLGVGVSSAPAIAANGSATAFASRAENLLGPGVDANNLTDVFAKDR